MSCYADVLSLGVMTGQPAPIRVAIVEDQREVREGLALLIGHTPGYLSRGSFGSVEEAMVHMKTACPDVVLIDIGLPGMSGIEGIRVMKPLCPQAQFLVLTVYDDDRRIFEAMCAGACGYLLKKTPRRCRLRWRGGRLRCFARCAPRGWRSGVWLRLTIRDNGRGFNPLHLSSGHGLAA